MNFFNSDGQSVFFYFKTIMNIFIKDLKNTIGCTQGTGTESPATYFALSIDVAKYANSANIQARECTTVEMGTMVNMIRTDDSEQGTTDNTLSKSTILYGSKLNSQKVESASRKANAQIKKFDESIQGLEEQIRIWENTEGSHSNIPSTSNCIFEF